VQESYGSTSGDDTWEPKQGGVIWQKRYLFAGCDSKKVDAALSKASKGAAWVVRETGMNWEGVKKPVKGGDATSL